MKQAECNDVKSGSLVQQQQQGSPCLHTGTDRSKKKKNL